MSAVEVGRLNSSAFVGGVPGLQLVVSKGGTRSWRLFYRLAGSDRRHAMTLGRFPALSLSEARRRANEKLALAADGSDPKQERRERAQARRLSVSEAATQYLVWCGSNNSPRTVEVKTSAFRSVILPKLGSRMLDEVDRRTLIDVLDGLNEREALRRSVYLYLSHFLGWCVEREFVAKSVIQDLRPPRPVRSRDRILTDTEIADLWSADGTMATIARMALLTAQRKASVEAMRWDTVCFETGTWTIPAADMKSARLHEVPISESALSILASWPRLNGPFLFGVGSDGAKPFAGASNGMDQLRRQVGNPDWRFHDLRRTAVTLAQRAGCSLESITALTQHRIPGVIGVYARHEYAAEKRLVVEAISKQAMRILRNA